MISKVEFKVLGRVFTLDNLAQVTLLTGPSGYGKREALSAVCLTASKEAIVRKSLPIIDRTQLYEGLAMIIKQAMSRRREETLELVCALFGQRITDVEVAPRDQIIRLELEEVQAVYPDRKPEEKWCIARSEEVGRMVYLLSVLVASSDGDVVMLECPEAGIHPSLFDVLAGAIGKAVVRGVQVVAVTHSQDFVWKVVRELGEQRAEMFCLYQARTAENGGWKRFSWEITRRVIGERGLSVIG